jgi:tRNA dimethylallyltransferase
MSCKGILLLLPLMNPNLIVILGPTASGKTKLAAGIAAALRTEIISADSRQVYQQMDIGTGKDLDEFTVNGYHIPHHLIDIIPAGERYHIHQFTTDFFAAFNHVQSLNKTPILCGGTGLYMDAILSNYEYTSVPINEDLRVQLQTHTKPELEKLFSALAAHPYKKNVDTSTTKRLIRGIEIITYLHQHSFTPTPFPKVNPIIFGTHVSVEKRRANIKKRLLDRLQNGLVEEVENLLKTISKEQLVYYGLEYKFVTLFLTGVLSYEHMQQQLLVAIQQYAKRQMTYFRKMERDGKHIIWIDAIQTQENQHSAVMAHLKQLHLT